MWIKDIDDRGQRLTEIVKENRQDALGKWVVVLRQCCDRLRGGGRFPTPSCVISNKSRSGEEGFDAAPTTAIAAGAVWAKWVMAPLACNTL